MKGVANERWTDRVRKEMELDRMYTRVLEILKKKQSGIKIFWPSFWDKLSIFLICSSEYINICLPVCVWAAVIHILLCMKFLLMETKNPRNTLFLIFKHSYLSLSERQFFYTTPLLEMVESKVFKKCKHGIIKV